MRHAGDQRVPTPRLRLTRLLLLVLLVWGLPSVWGQTGLNVTGTVKARNGSPKQFVNVQLNGPGRYVAVSNAQGVFTLTNVVPGYYNIKVRQGDYVETFAQELKSDRLNLVVKW